MKILITGGAGFIGSQLGYHLSNVGHDVVLLDDLSFGTLDNLTITNKTFGLFVKADVRDIDFARHLDGVSVVFHFAAIAPLPVNQSDPARGYSVNVVGWSNVLEACRRAKINKVVLASTSAVYENNEVFPVKEDDTISPYLLYSMTKKHSEDIAESFVKLYGMDISILRFFNVYGPHHDFRRKSPPLIAYIIKCLMLGEIPILHSDGKQKRDYVYVSDVCRACELVMQPGNSGEAFNVASGTVISMSDIYAKIAAILKSDLRPKYRDPNLLWDAYSELNEGFKLDPEYIAKETNKYCCGSNDKAKRILGWEPCVSFDDGIQMTVEYAVKSGL
jgi:UDP-glucose 4-epimerase